jgi:hypothetical protein
MANLVNAFGKIALDETSRDTRELLEAIIVELRILNLHMAKMNDEEISSDDVDRYGE